MPTTSLRSLIAKNLAPLRPQFYSSGAGVGIHCQLFEPPRTEPLPRPLQFNVESEVINIPVTVSPDWLPVLLAQAMPTQYGHTHKLPLLEAQSTCSFPILIDEANCIKINLPGWLVKSPQAFVALFDLFEPLSWTNVDGKHYGLRQIQAEKSSVHVQEQPSEQPQIQESYEPASEIPLRAKKKHHRRPHPSFWDIISPLLQPSPDLDSSKPVFLPHPLYRFQHPGVKFLIEHPSALLGDEMGTGKTVMASVAMRLLFRRARVHCVLVVCPVSVLRVWERHLAEWAPELFVTVAHGASRLWAVPAHVYVTSYDTLRNDMQKGGLPERIWHKFDLVVADEIQYVKNPSSKRSQSLRKLQPKWRWGLSGTPMENKPGDIVAIFQFLRPGLLDDDSPSVIRQRMDSYFLRRRKKDVLSELPPKVRQEIWLDLNPAQRRAYRAVEAQIRGDFVDRRKRGEEISRIHIFSAITKLKQICNFAPGKTESHKTNALKYIVGEIAASNSKVIVFSQYVEEGINKLERLLEPYGVAKVVGEQSRTVRDAEISRFRRDSKTHVLLATIKSGGVGLTLTEASYVIHFDHWWNPALKWQAEDRVHRPGQQATSVNIYEFWMRDTIDQRIFDILKRKQLLFEEIVDSLSDEKIDQSISEEEWLSVLGVSVGINRSATRKSR